MPPPMTRTSGELATALHLTCARRDRGTIRAIDASSPLGARHSREAPQFMAPTACVSGTTTLYDGRRDDHTVPKCGHSRPATRPRRHTALPMRSMRGRRGGPAARRWRRPSGRSSPRSVDAADRRRSDQVERLLATAERGHGIARPRDGPDRHRRGRPCPARGRQRRHPPVGQGARPSPRGRGVAATHGPAGVRDAVRRGPVDPGHRPAPDDLGRRLPNVPAPLPGARPVRVRIGHLRAADLPGETRSGPSTSTPSTDTGSGPPTPRCSPPSRVTRRSPSTMPAGTRTRSGSGATWPR